MIFVKNFFAASSNVFNSVENFLKLMVTVGITDINTWCFCFLYYIHSSHCKKIIKRVNAGFAVMQVKKGVRKCVTS